MTLTMTGRLAECVLLAYRTPAASVRALVPAGLELVTHGDWAFWNIVVCRVADMRPAGLPAWLGISYSHVAYRLYARARTADGANVEGLYFLRSEADNALIAGAGNWFSDFRFHRAAIDLQATDSAVDLRVISRNGRKGDASLSAREMPAPELAPGSCFDTAAEAAAFLKYRPLGLAVDARSATLKLAEVFRHEQQWQERPLQVTAARWQFLASLGQHDAQLEWASRVAPIDYRWRLGRRLPLAARSSESRLQPAER
ncbi:hypothetical protein LBMAG56_33320 [Verrucomicrobiota bacterium]|nr:hypothetical protein LBMAG56_33320 [Verrucomicrobiota bacterium]